MVSWEKEAKNTVSALKKAIFTFGDGVGLAAPQIGKKGRVFVIKSDIVSHSHDQGQKESKALVFINPEIKKAFGSKVYPAMENEHGHRQEFLEGCLSVPDIYGPVKRWLKIAVFWQEPSGSGNLEEKSSQLEGMAAIVFQHELDHLNGVLFIDHVKKDKRNLFRFTKSGERVKASFSELENR